MVNQISNPEDTAVTGSVTQALAKAVDKQLNLTVAKVPVINADVTVEIVVPKEKDPAALSRAVTDAVQSGGLVRSMEVGMCNRL